MQKTKTPVTLNVIEAKFDYDCDVNYNNDDMSENPTPSTSSLLPFILQGEFFTVTPKSTGQKIIARCTNCPKIISGSRTSTGNFVSHYNVSCTFFIFSLTFFLCIIQILLTFIFVFFHIVKF